MAMGGYERLKPLRDGGYTLVAPSVLNETMRVWGRVNPGDSVLGGRVGGDDVGSADPTP